MKNLVLSAMLFAGLTQAAGCIIVSDDAPTDFVGDIGVNWSLLSTDAAGNNIGSTCPAGSGTITLYALRDGDTQPYTDKYLCSDTSGLMDRLPEGAYTVWLEITDTSGATKFAISGDYQATVVADGLTPVNVSLYTDRAFFAASWNLTRLGAPTSCAAVNADKVSVLATVSGGSNGFDDDSNQCITGEGTAVAFTTLPVPTGQSYTVVIAALNAAGLSIGDSAPLVNRALQIGNAALDLQTVEIPIR